MKELEVKVMRGIFIETDNCHGGCDFYSSRSYGCRMGWATLDPEATTEDGYKIGCWVPGIECPGNGFFRFEGATS